MTNAFPCPACGAPNEPEAGRIQMACSYCGANLTIPASMRMSAPPKLEKAPERVAPAASVEIDAPELLRKAQPVAVKAWNAYAYWTWIRRALPVCLIVMFIGLCLCAALTILPIILNTR